MLVEACFRDVWSGIGEVGNGKMWFESGMRVCEWVYVVWRLEGFVSSWVRCWLEWIWYWVRPTFSLREKPLCRNLRFRLVQYIETRRPGPRRAKARATAKTTATTMQSQKARPSGARTGHVTSRVAKMTLVVLQRWVSSACFAACQRRATTASQFCRLRRHRHPCTLRLCFPE